MTKFRDNKIDKLFRPGGLFQLASTEDLALAEALCRTLRKCMNARTEQLALMDDITLDPLPSKSIPQDDAAED